MPPKMKIRYDNRIKYLPINLKKKAQREFRLLNGGVGRNHKRNQKKRCSNNKSTKHEQDFELIELKSLLLATTLELKSILENEPLLFDIPCNVTPEELKSAIAVAGSCGMTLYIERDGLSTLQVVLPQPKPTIANLKRAIETAARVQLKRELSNSQAQRAQKSQQQQQQKQQQLVTQLVCSASVSATTNKEKMDTFCATIRTPGELVCSSTRNGHHHHRPNASWRFLWRAYAIYNITTRQPIKDDNGRQLLSECGIENAHTLKFCKREKYFGRQRQ